MNSEHEIVTIITTDWTGRACSTAEERVAAELAEPTKRLTPRDAEQFVDNGLKFARGLKRSVRNAMERHWRHLKLAQDLGDATGRAASLAAIRALDELLQRCATVSDDKLAELLTAHWNQLHAV